MAMLGWEVTRGEARLTPQVLRHGRRWRATPALGVPDDRSRRDEIEQVRVVGVENLAVLRGEGPSREHPAVLTPMGVWAHASQPHPL